MPEPPGESAPADTTRDDQRKPAEKKWPATVLLVAPFFYVLASLYKSARHDVNWKAAITTIITFEAVMFPAEHFSIARGHWIWNDSRILGTKLWEVPVEEPLLYYWFPPLFVILLMHTIRRILQERTERQGIAKENR